MNNKIRNEARSSASDQAAAAGAYNGGKSIGKQNKKPGQMKRSQADKDAGVARMRDEDEAAKKAQRDRFAAMKKESYTPTKDKDDYNAKAKVLQGIQLDPETSKDPELRKELIKRKNALEKDKAKLTDAYDHPEGAKLSRLGRILMDKAITTKDDALSNVLSRVGDELTRYGAPGGARDIKELESRTKLPQAKIMKLMSWADSQKDDSISKVKDPKPSDEPDGEDGEFDEDMQGKDNMGFTDKQIKMAYGVLNNPRYKGGNYSGAVEVINKIAPGLADHPSVAKALQRTNEAVKESANLTDKELVDAVFKAIDLANSLDVHYAVDKVGEFAEDLYSAVNGTNESVCSECNKPRFVAMPESIQKQYSTVNEEKQKGVDGKVCWKGYKRMGTKKKGGKTVDNCVKM